ncbi:MAG: hypothetical protein QW837_06670 [Conexivisphaerales archaeon]
MIKRYILGQFWKGIYKKHVVNMTKLDARRMEYIVVREKAGGKNQHDISQALGISKKRVDQVYRYYRENSSRATLVRELSLAKQSGNLLEKARRLLSETAIANNHEM